MALLIKLVLCTMIPACECLRKGGNEWNVLFCCCDYLFCGGHGHGAVLWKQGGECGGPNATDDPATL